MTLQASYGGFTDNLLTTGGDRLLAVEVTTPFPQRIISCTCSCIPAASNPTQGQMNGIARLLIYVGSLASFLTDLRTDASIVSPLNTFEISRVLANLAVPMGKDVQFIVPQVQSDRLHAQAGETLGAAILCPITLDSTGSFFTFNAYVSLDFYGTTIEAADTPKYKAV